MNKQLFLHGIGGPVHGLVVDLFAGGGGASTGIEQAIGRAVDIAIDHDPAAIRMHEVNHPGTAHRCESIFDVDPLEATKGEPVALLWASPSCTHFSRARGGTPVSRQLRGLGWMVLRWAGKVRPATIVCENVAEWETWGPVRRGQPWKRRKGAHWRLFLASLRAMGYTVEHRVLNAADYGAPTSRRRLFLVARADGAAVVWPAPTHGPKGVLPYRTAAECIDWSDLGRSIFERKKPLAPATCRRIAAGIVRYVLEGKPFIVTCNHGKEGFRCQGMDEPMKTITAARDAHGLVTPYLVTTGHGERAGQAPRTGSVQDPLGTVVATAQNHALRTAFLAKHYGGVVGQPMDKTLGTVTAVDHHSLVAAHLTKLRNNCVGQDAERPLDTVTTGGHFALCAAFLTTYYTGGGSANGVDKPMPAIVAKARHGLVVVEIDGETYALADMRLRMLKPTELARAQGFPVGYVLTGTQAEQIGRLGNSVCPPVAAALVRANLPAVRRATA